MIEIGSYVFKKNFKKTRRKKTYNCMTYTYHLKKYLLCEEYAWSNMSNFFVSSLRFFLMYYFWKAFKRFYPKINLIEFLFCVQSSRLKSKLNLMLFWSFCVCMKRKKLCNCHSSFFSSFPSRHFFWTGWQKLFSKFCPIAALSACDQDRS